MSINLSKKTRIWRDKPRDGPETNDINLDISHRCTLLCSGCGRQREYLDKGLKVPGHDMTIEEFHKITDFFSSVTCCGQKSDPLMNNNLPQFITIAKTKGIKLQINTAVSHRPERWYRDCFDRFGRGRWTFGIDGLPKDSHKYRINQDGEKLYRMMTLASSMGIECVWQYIIFRYNENDIEEAAKMSKDINVRLMLQISNRFTENDPLRPINPKYNGNKNNEDQRYIAS